MSGKKRKKRKSSPLLLILFLIALGVFCFSGYKLVTTLLDYKAGTDEYNEIGETFTTAYETGTDGAEGGSSFNGGSGSGGNGDLVPDGQGSGSGFEDADPPLTVDFAELQAVNSDIVGWLYVDAFSETISYPILQGEDNDYYLHRTFRRQSVFAGSIFEDYENSPDFSDANTIIYGHNMKNRSMFGMLKFLKEQDRYDKDPYFWILTPQGNYRYKIFAAFETPVGSDVYTLFGQGGEEFLAWEEKQQERSAVKNEVPLDADDFVVTLSTCTSNSSTRFVVLGKCVSTARPVRTEKIPETGEETQLNG